MRIYPTILVGALGLALAAGIPAAQAQQSWGPKWTTYFNSDHTGKFERGQFMRTPQTTQVQVEQPQPRMQRRMYYRTPASRVRMPIRVYEPVPGPK